MGQAPPSSEVTDADIEAAARILAGGKVVVFTGAGVSAESGVPTYRDPGGLWRKYDMKKVSHINGFLKDPIACWRFEMELYRLLQGVQPNAGHRAIAELEAAGFVTGVVTQNVEGLHTAAGSRNVIELHGNETRAVCLRCGERCSAVEAFRRVGWLGEKNEIMEDALPDVSTILANSGDASSSSPSTISVSTQGSRGRPRTPSYSDSRSSSSSSPEPWRGVHSPPAPPGAPSCPSCGVGLLKPDAVYFGEDLDTSTLRNAERLFTEGGVALLVGSSCRVAPASTLPLLLRKNGGQLIDVNPEGSRISRLADKWLKGRSADVLPRLARAVTACQTS